MNAALLRCLLRPVGGIAQRRRGVKPAQGAALTCTPPMLVLRDSDLASVIEPASATPGPAPPTPWPIRTRHDEWSKRAPALWRGRLADVQLDPRFPGEPRRGECLYTERGGGPGLRAKFGVLGELARARVLFEPFRNPPSPRE